MARDAAPVRCNPRQRSEAWTGHSSRDRGRHPTDTSKVVPNPRISAGSTVAYCWLRLFPCTEVKKHDADLKSRLAVLDIGSHINAGGEPASRIRVHVSPTLVFLLLGTRGTGCAEPA